MKTFEQINERIRDGSVVVMTAEEVIAMVAERGVRETARKVDVVTTGTFGPMCSSGAFINFGHSDTPIRMAQIWLNNVQGYGGLAAVDTFIGATQPSDDRGIAYGGAHVIEDLIAGKPVSLRASSYGTDCYPLREAETTLTINDLNQAYLYNPRNCYQNYAAATNSSGRVLHTYMGTLLPNFGNVTYSTSGELSPLLKDPHMRAVGIGTRVFLGGTQGYVAWEGTQHVMNHEKIGDGWRHSGATLALIGDMKKMNTRYVRGAVYSEYGVSLFVGVGIPFPVLDEDMLLELAQPNERIYTKVFDYAVPNRQRPAIKSVSYAQLRSGRIELNGRQVSAAPLSSLLIAREIAQLLKEAVAQGRFLLQAPIAPLPDDNVFKPLGLDKEGR